MMLPRVPDNVSFEIDDVEAKDWSWPDNHFDYIHSRFMICSISSWKRYIRKAFQYVFFPCVVGRPKINGHSSIDIRNPVATSNCKN